MNDDGEVDPCFLWPKLISIGTSIAMLVFAFRWKSEVLSQLGQADPCDVLITVEVDNFRLTVANHVLVPLIVVGFLVMLTMFFVCNERWGKYTSFTSMALLLTVLVVEGVLFGVVAAGIAKSADYYTSAIGAQPNPMRLYNWYNGSAKCSAAMDKFQSEAICCGYHNLYEWDKTRPSNWDKDIFPPSCCSDFALRTASPTDRKWCTKKVISFSNVPCISQLKFWIFRQWVGTVAWIALGVGIFQILCIMGNIYSRCHSEDEDEPERRPIIRREIVHVPVPVRVENPPRIVKRMQYEEICG